MLAALLLPMLAAADAGAPAAAWRAAGPGLEHARLALGDADLLRFDLARFRVDVVVSGAQAPRTAVQLRREHAAATAAVNGGFFDTDWRSLGLRIAGGRTVQGLRPRVDWGVLLIERARARIIHSRDYAPDARVTAAVQVGPRILIDGHIPPLKPQRGRRAAVGLDREGRRLTLLVTRGSASADDIARALAATGCHTALLLDGGPSAQLSAQLGPTTIEIPGGYAVPDALIFTPVRAD
jgi:hypothetical protein